MKLPHFKLESYFAKWEFAAKHLLCASDVESFRMQEILSMADDQCRELWANLSLGYTETQGLPFLREEISKQYYNIEPSDTLTFAGAEEGIYCAMQALLKEGDHAIVITPCYQSLEAIPRSLCEVTAVSLSPENKWELDIAALEKALRPNTTMIVINYPHNPTGATLSIDKLDRLVSLARKRKITIFSDEVYRGLELDIGDRIPAIADAYERGISLSVMSKAYGMGGLRVGWLAAQNGEAIQKIAEFKHYTSLCNSAPSEILSLIALRNSGRILSRNREFVKYNIALLDDFLQRQSKRFSWIRPKSGPIGYIKILSGEDSESFCGKVLEDTGILLLPGSIYNSEESYFRIGFGRKDMPAVLEKFETYLYSMSIGGKS